MARDIIKFWRLQEYPDIEFLCGVYHNHLSAPYIHKGYKIGLIEEGVEEVSYRDEGPSSARNRIVLVNPNRIHTFPSRNNSVWSTRIAYIDPTYFSLSYGGEPKEIEPLPCFDREVIHDRELAELFKWMHLSMENSSSDIVKNNMLRAFISYLLTHHSSKNNSTKEGKSERSAVMRVKELIQADFNYDLTIQEIAEHAYLSPFHLSRVFKKEMGISIHKYVNLIRINQAKELLRLKETPVATANETGFVDQSHFTHWFKRIVGVTPSAYRSAYK